MARVFVVGGAGYIGSHCSKALIQAGHESIVYDNLSTGHATFVRWGPLIEGDIRDGERLGAAIRDTKPDAVMHFAALALVGESVEDPLRYYDVNVVGTWHILNAMRVSGVRHLVFSSSCAVYGQPSEIPIAETTHERPVNPYGATKLACERMIADCEPAYGLRSMRLRYFNAAGADPSGEIGEWHEKETHLIPLAVRAALGQGPELKIFGSDYPTADGTAVRDYIHVNDLASAHLAAVNHLLAGGQSHVLNLGTGQGSSVAAVIAEVARLTGRAVPVQWTDRRPGDPPHLVADPMRAEALLAWRAQKRDIGVITEDALRWHRSHNAG
jgi:UDP-arabinose 4-epimerase